MSGTVVVVTRISFTRIAAVVFSARRLLLGRGGPPRRLTPVREVRKALTVLSFDVVRW
jgi:hypothetical protein